MRRRYRWVAVAAVFSLATTAGCTKSHDAPKASYTAKVTTPGEYRLGDDVTVTVPDGAVKPGAKLHLDALQTVSATTAAPLQGVRQSAVTFDLSLDGDVQPSKPLGISIAVRGAFLPAGAKVEQALLYTQPNSSAGWQIVPSILRGDVLQTNLNHLSPKAVVFATPKEALAQVVADDLLRVALSSPADVCPQSVDTPAGKVSFGSGNEGWSKESSSPVQPCLFANGEAVSVSVANHANYMWSVAATDGVSPKSLSQKAQVELAKRLTAQIFPNSRVKAYLGNEETLQAIIAQKDMPATIQLRADPSTFLTQVSLFAFTFLTGIMTGKNVGQVIEIVDKLLSSVEILDCLSAAVKLSKGDIGSLLDAVVSECTLKIAEGLNFLALDPDAWKVFWGRWLTIAQGIEDGIDLLTTAYNGIKQQIKGDVTVVVRATAPCTTEADFVRLTKARDGAGAKKIEVHGAMVCDGDWAIANVYIAYANNQSTNVIPLLHRVGGAWTWYRGGTDPMDKRADCGEYSAAVKKYLGCSPQCPTARQFQNAFNTFYGSSSARTTILGCQTIWAVGWADTPNGSGPSVIEKLVGSSWKVVSYYHHSQVTCDALPEGLRSIAGCP